LKDWAEDAQEYRRYARHTLVRARQMTNPGTRTLMIDIALIWLRMAEISARHMPVVQQQQQVQPKNK
jgi:hypothetical protein